MLELDRVSMELLDFVSMSEVDLIVSMEEYLV